MNLNTFFQTCIYICIGLIVFTLAINFVSATGVFDPVSSGVPADDTSGTFEGFTGGFSMDLMWITVLSIAGLASVAVAILMHSAIPVGVYIFSAVFWASYGNALGVLGGLSIPSGFLLMGTTGYCVSRSSIRSTSLFFVVKLRFILYSLCHVTVVA